MQNFYNLLYREEEREMLPLCADARIAVLPWSPLARGRLDARLGHRDASHPHRHLRQQAICGHRRNRIARSSSRSPPSPTARGVPRAQVALAWVLQKAVVTAPIVGASKPQHLDDAVAALDLKLTADRNRATRGALCAARRRRPSVARACTIP